MPRARSGLASWAVAAVVLLVLALLQALRSTEPLQAEPVPAEPAEAAALQPAAVTAAAPATSLVALSPARLADTRAGQATIDGAGPKGAVGAGQTITLAVAGRGGVPSTGAGAVVLNVTVVGAGVVTYLTVWPSGSPRPTASSLNAASPAAVPNLVTTRLGADGSVSIFNAAGSVHLVVDVAGYYPAVGTFVAINPARLADTRAGQSTIDGQGPKGALGPQGETVVAVAGRAGLPASGVTAVALNLTVDQASSMTYLTVWPSGTVRPLASSLNPSSPSPIANAVVVPLGSDGAVRVFNANGQAHVIVDIAGYFVGGGGFTPMSPTRLVDTRPAYGTVDGGGPKGIIGARQTMTFIVTGRGGIPATGVGAVVFNLTADAATTPTYFTAWPTGAARPLASNLNPSSSAAVANLVVAKVGLDGRVSVLNDNGAAHMIVDVAGWIAGDPTEPVDAGPIPIAERVQLPGMGADQTIRYSVSLAAGARFAVGAFPQASGGDGLRCGATLRLLRGDGTPVASSSVPCSGPADRSLDLEATFSGTAPWYLEYTTSIRRTGNAGWIQLYPTIAASPAVATVNVAGQSPVLAAGQDATFTFTPATGRPFVVSWALRAGSPGEVADFCDVAIRLFRPDGTVATTAVAASSGSCVEGPDGPAFLTTEPSTSTGGTWRAELDNGAPAARPAGAFVVAQTDPPATITLPTKVTTPALAAGLSRAWRFDATSGRTVSLEGIVPLGSSAGCLRIDLLRPNSSVGWTESWCPTTSGITTGRIFDRDVTLDTTGTWTLQVANLRPVGLPSFDLWVSSDIVLTAAPDSLVTLPALQPGQNLRATVTLEAGRRYGLSYKRAPSDPFGGSDFACAPLLQVLRPNGTPLFAESETHPVLGSCGMTSWTPTITPDVAGTWTVLVDGRSLGAAAGGQLAVSRELDGGTLTLGTPATLPTMLPRQLVTYRLALTAGQVVSMSIGFPQGGGDLATGVRRPDGTLVDPLSNGGIVAPVTGTYTVTFAAWENGRIGDATSITVFGAIDGGLLVGNVATGTPAIPAGRIAVWSFDVSPGAVFRFEGLDSPGATLIDPTGREYLPPLWESDAFRAVNGGRWRVAYGVPTVALDPGWSITFRPARSFSFTGAPLTVSNVGRHEPIWIESPGPLTGTLEIEYTGPPNDYAVYPWAELDGRLSWTSYTQIPTPNGEYVLTGQRIIITGVQRDSPDLGTYTFRLQP